MYERHSRKRLVTFLAIAILILFLQNLYDNRDVNYLNTSENLVYQVDKNTKVRYKYYMGYETVDSHLKRKLDGEPLYTLKTESEEFEVYREQEIPEVSRAFSVKKGDLLEEAFEISINENIDRDKVRIDVRIVVEELRNGKWTEVYHVVLKESGLYWSLDKGPIEFIKVKEND